MPARLVIEDSLEEVLEKLPLAAREKEVQRALRAGAKLAKDRAAQLAPVPGYKGDKPGKTPLRDTMTIATRSYQGGGVQFVGVGPRWPDGAHGHLVEFGHEIVTKKPNQVRTGARVPGKEFVAPAIDQTIDQQTQKIDASLLRAIKRHGG